MRRDGQTMNGHEMATPHLALESAREWAKRTLTKERIADIVVCVSAVTVLGLILDSLHRAMETCTVVGTAPF